MSNKTVNSVQRSNQIYPTPRNTKQKDYLHSLTTNTQTFALGPAGTGKTFLAASVAAFFMMRGKVDKFYMTRPTVEVEEQIGFLPGDEKKKLAPWTWPIIEVLEECYQSREKVNQFIKEGQVAVQPFVFMRGRTFKDAFVLLDEAQNTTLKQMETFLTRIGENSVIVVNGDPDQSDIQGRSGLDEAMDMIYDMNIPAGMVRFTDDEVERSEICSHWVKAYRKKKEERRGLTAPFW